MNWDARLVARGELAPLPDLLTAHLAAQVASWPQLREAIAALDRVRSREVRVGQRLVRVQWTPGRAASSTAKVDAATVRTRPCFLCPANQPPQERGLPFGDTWVILPNPAPILRGHLVIAHRDHRPQSLRAGLTALLDFAEAAGPARTALYNGPQCGASAPDHLHLQGVAAGELPEEVHARQLLSANRVEPFACSEGFLAWNGEGAGRTILGLAGRRDRVEAAVLAAVSALETGPEEPRLNLLATMHDCRLLVLVFPRQAHRPGCFFKDGPEQRLVSPGIVDMAGVLVTVREQDFEALDGPTLEEIFQEVTLSRDRSAAWYEALVERWSHA